MPPIKPFHRESPYPVSWIQGSSSKRATCSISRRRLPLQKGMTSRHLNMGGARLLGPRGIDGPLDQARPVMCCHASVPRPAIWLSPRDTQEDSSGMLMIPLPHHSGLSMSQRRERDSLGVVRKSSL
ncbi:hypothetical protein JTE90_010684 [Oedothorax gibbosus]|uniref:Uncharacterized protein n=1 Tax=Oedothorax gibbosus TaxID=931172 RepID=A0AAV6URB2_9ARAC|nr:hypothetical protein JTE90_010684 [Oedothorax gibbosus]